jgi:RTX calcium-binding nonapeptide repeat (4 copies)
MSCNASADLLITIIIFYSIGIYGRFYRTFLLILHILYIQKVHSIKLNGSYSTEKMLLLAVEVVTITLLLSTMIWLTPTAITQAALAQTANNITCYGHTATIVGTESADIVGTLGDDVIVTLGAGRDRIHGLGGNDFICGGRGHNTIIGGTGDDIIDGGNGSDYLSGGTGDDRIIGGTGNDTLFGEDGNDRLDGGLGNDTFFGQDGDDFLFGDAIDGATDRRNIDSGDGGSEFDICVNVETVINCEG